MKWNLWKWVAGMSWRHSLVVFGILVLLSVYFTSNLKFSYDYTDFFPENDPDLEFYLSYREQFEADDNFLLVGFRPGNGIFERSFLTSLDSLTASLEEMEGVAGVHSVTNYRFFIHSPFGFIDYPAVHQEDSSRYASDSLRLMEDTRVNGKLISPDGSTTIILVKTTDTLPQGAKQFIEEVRSAAWAVGLSDHHLLGKAYFEKELAELQMREFILFSFLSVLLVIITTWLMYRKFTVVLLAVITVAVSLLLFTGILGALGIEQNILSTLFPIVIIIVGISDVVHFLGKYLLELRRNSNRHIALFRTLSDVGFATFLTAITSAIGFISMLTSNVPPVRFFGLYSALGVLVVYVVTVFFTAPLLKSFRPEQLDAYRNRIAGRLDIFINNLYVSGKQRSKTIVAATIVVLAFFLFGATRISTNIHIGSGLPKGAVVTEDFAFFESAFNGFRPFEIAARSQNGMPVYAPSILRQIDTVEQYAEQFDIVNGVQSITMFYKSMHRAYGGDRAIAYKLPTDDSLIISYSSILKRIAPGELRMFVSDDGMTGRISGFVRDAGTDSIQAMQDKLENFISENTNDDEVVFTPTGTGLIFDKNTAYLRRNIISGVLLAFLCIGVVMGYLFRDLRMVLISIIPNVIPLVICAGSMGWLGIELDAPTSIIFGISYGIAVDDTIHFLSKFNIERRRGFSVELALQHTFAETGKAVITMSLILVFGFLILMLSPTAATFNIGMLTGVTLFSAVWPDIFLLPLLIRRWMK